MSTRQPTDDAGATLFDADRVAATAHEAFERAATDVNPRIGFTRIEQATPTRVESSAPAGLTARPERSEPVRAISMKDQAGAPQRRPNEPLDPRPPRVPLHIQLRSMAEVSGRHDTPAGGMGHLAPPRDARQARARRVRSNVVWASVALALAGAISLAIWLIAGR